MFIDRAEISVKAGKGGDGAVHFRREIYEPAGGPDGGDGGDGGSVIFQVDEGMNTLMDFKYKRKYQAEHGADGQKKNMFGKKGKDLIIKVPKGTIIYEKESGKIMADLSEKGESVVICRGGRGGKGNTHFKNSRRQAPDFAQPGTLGQGYDIVLELKTIADVGLVGYPNVGKSSLLKRITKANPKIANYHFTTLQPNLGVVEVIEGKSFVMADIPGIIEGASEGIGLGHDFLRHIERTRLILHVLDASGSEDRDPIKDFEVIEKELLNFSEKLATREKVVFLNKVDLVYDREELKRIEQYFKDREITTFLTSTVTGEGVVDGMKTITSMLENIEPENLFEELDYFVEELPSQEIFYDKDEEGYYVSGEPIERLMRGTNFNSYTSKLRFQVTLKRMGVFDKLRQMGIEDGDTVHVLDYAFDYFE